MAKAKSKYQFERIGTKPRKGDKVVSVAPEEANGAWGTPHTVVEVDEIRVYARPLKSDIGKDGGGRDYVFYLAEGFSKNNWTGYAFNRVLKRDTK